MESNLDTEINQTQETTQQPRERAVRKGVITAPWRYTFLPDGTFKYDKRPLDPNYTIKYYWNVNANRRIECPHCKAMFRYSYKARHDRTAKCQRIRKLREQMRKDELAEEAEKKSDDYSEFD